MTVPVDATFPTPLLIGMIHLPPLPGSPGFAESKSPGDESFIEHALRDARTLSDAGFGCAMVENFGDMPFSPDGIAPETVAAMALVVREVRRATGLTVGVNCLRNDARSALGVAASAGAAFIRVNVHSGMAATDQGMLTGKADETVRERSRICPQVRIFADVHVKHAVPVNQPDIALAAEETAYRGRADAVIVSGTSTGRPVNRESLAKVKEAVPDRWVLIGSGANAESIGEMLEVCDGVIVGSSLKRDGDIAAPIDAQLANEFVNACK